MTTEDPVPMHIANKVAARARAVRLANIVMPMHWRGETLQKIADRLNDARIVTAQGKTWHPAQVRRVIRRLTE